MMIDTTTPDPVSAHDLAEALRGATDALSVIGIEWGLDPAVEEDNARWVNLLERWDGQCLSLALLQALSDRDAAMRFAYRYQDGSDAKYVKAKVARARKANWQALRLRRELRALGGDA